MRRAAIVPSLVFVFSCSGEARPPVTLAAAKAPPAPSVDLGADGRIERELTALRARDAKDPATRPARYEREIGLFAELSRCREARELAGEIATKGDDAAKRAASEAVAECDRLDRKPAAEALASMRSAFREARALEAKEPARAEKLYAKAWADVPSLAAMLGIARAAKAAGDAALAERSFERALGFAERGGDHAKLVASAPMPEDTMPVTLFAGSRSAVLSIGNVLFHQDFATGALSVLAAIPDGFEVSAASERFALLAAGKGSAAPPPRLLEMGVDDVVTATPLDDLAGATELALSPDGALAAATTSDCAVVVDLATGKLVGKTKLDAGDSYIVGFTADRELVVREAHRICVLSPPSYDACRADAALRMPLLTRSPPAPYVTASATTIGGHALAWVDPPGTMRVYDLRARRVVRTFTGHFFSVHGLALSPDLTSLISISTSRNFFWDLATGKHVETSTEVFGPSPVWAGDSQHVLVTWDGASSIETVSPRSMVAAGSVPNAHGGRVFAFAASGALWVGGRDLLSRVDLAHLRVEGFPVDGRAEDILVAPDESLVALRMGGPYSEIRVYDRTGKPVASGEMMEGEMRFEGRHLVVVGVGTTDDVLDLDTQKVTSRPTSGVPNPSTAAEAKSPDGRWTVKNGAGGLIAVTDARGGASTLDLARTAFVWTSPDGSSVLGGHEASARCLVGTAWLPVDACRDRLVRP